MVVYLLWILPCWAGENFDLEATDFIETLNTHLQQLKVIDLKGDVVSLGKAQQVKRGGVEYYEIYDPILISIEVSPENKHIKNIRVILEFAHKASLVDNRNLSFYHGFFSAVLVNILPNKRDHSEKAVKTYQNLLKSSIEDFTSKDKTGAEKIFIHRKKRNLDERLEVEYFLRNDFQENITYLMTTITPR